MQYEGFLEGMQLPPIPILGSQAFDGDDLLPSGTLGRIDARQNRLAIHHHGTGTAFSFVATDLGTCEPEALTQQVGQGFPGQGWQDVFFSVNSNRDSLSHSLPILHQPVPKRSEGSPETIPLPDAAGIPGWRDEGLSENELGQAALQVQSNFVQE